MLEGLAEDHGVIGLGLKLHIGESPHPRVYATMARHRAGLRRWLHSRHRPAAPDEPAAEIAATAADLEQATRGQLGQNCQRSGAERLSLLQAPDQTGDEPERARGQLIGTVGLRVEGSELFRSGKRERDAKPTGFAQRD